MQARNLFSSTLGTAEALSGTNVMVLKIYSPKKCNKILAFWVPKTSFFAIIRS
jgi:hypothetical protein